MPALDANIELAGVDTSMPVLETNENLPVVIKDVDVASNKDKTGRNLVVKFATLNEERSTKGDPVNAGYPLTKYFPLQQSKNDKAPDFRRDICKLIDACFGTTQEDRPSLNSETIEALKGKELLVSVKIREATDEFDAQNEIRSFKPLM